MKCKDIGNAPLYPYLGPHLVKYLLEMGPVVDIVIRSLDPVAGTNNPGGIQKPDNPLEVIRNPIPWNPDNPLTGIQDLVQKGTLSKWPRGLTIPT